ncbi:hypothetical protein J6O07_25530 (plasmid) [Escherichia coli]|nr:hypothetical protein J6O07_25530 [Escherichia coli]
MADSEFSAPDAGENISMLRNDLFAGLDVSDTLRRMDRRRAGKGVCGGAAYGLLIYIDYLAMNMLPDLCRMSPGWRDMLR